MCPRHRHDGNSRLDEPSAISFHGPGADLQFLGECLGGNRHRRVRENFDQALLADNASQRQVVVTAFGARLAGHSCEFCPIPDTAVAVMSRTLLGMAYTELETIEAFFARYTGYLSDGDLGGLADIYNYPALAVSPRGCMAVTEPQQTRDFFAQGQQFYRSRGIQSVRAKDIVTEIEANGIWVGHLVLENLDDVGTPAGEERNAYQIVVDGDGKRRIAVTTPLDGV